MATYNIIFAGTPEFSVKTLAALMDSEHHVKAVYTQPDRKAGRGQQLMASPVKELALAHHIPVHQPISLRDENAQQILASFNADIMIVVAYGLLLPVPVLEAPKLGCINVHASLLPRWRGAAPIQRAILAGDDKTGITIMQMDKGLDTGEMLYKVECPIEPHDTSATLHDRLADLGAEALLKTLNQLDHIKAEKQNNELATYAHKIAKDEAEIDWKMSAVEIDRKIRAFNPWPVAFTHCDDTVLRVWKSEVIPEHKNAASGTILEISRQGIDIAAGKGILRLLQIQLPGGKALPVSDILNSKAQLFSPGKCLK